MHMTLPHLYALAAIEFACGFIVGFLIRGGF
jgi:hypothetical protein